MAAKMGVPCWNPVLLKLPEGEAGVFSGFSHQRFRRKTKSVHHCCNSLTSSSGNSLLDQAHTHVCHVAFVTAPKKTSFLKSKGGHDIVMKNCHHTASWCEAGGGPCARGYHVLQARPFA